MKGNKYQGAYSRRRFSNYNVVGQEKGSVTANGFNLNATSANPGMGDVQIRIVGGSHSELGATAVSQTGRANGTLYRVTALPFDGCRFAGWIGDYPAGAKLDNPITVALTKNIALTATFERIENNYNLRVAWNDEMGRVSCNSNAFSNGQISLAPGSRVTLTASPKDGYVFDHWDGVNLAGNVQNNNSKTITITMPARNLSISAVFAKVVDNPGGGGGTPGNGTLDGIEVPGNVPSSMLASDSLTEKAMCFVKKWWWAIAIALWLYYDSKKGGSR